MDLPTDELLDLATSLPIDLPSSPSPPDSEADSLRELADDPRPLEYDPTLPGWEVGPTTASKKRARQASLSGSINSNTAHTHALSTNVDPTPDRIEGSPGAPPKRVSWRDPIETKLPLQMESGTRDHMLSHTHLLHDFSNLWKCNNSLSALSLIHI